MKKPKEKETPKTTSATVTSTARLTIQGQTFEMPLAELEDLYQKIGAALCKRKPSEMDEYRKIIDRLPRFEPPHYIQPPTPIPARPGWMPPDVICTVTGTDPMWMHGNTCSVGDGSVQLGKHSDQRDRFGS